MTVLRFRSAARAIPESAEPPSTTTPVAGTFWSPSGGRGSFTGTYRLERLLDQYGQTAAAGVFTGQLADSDGQPIGTGSRRHTAAVELLPGVGLFAARMGPLDVNVLGFLVTVDEFVLTVPRGLPASLSDSGMPASMAELLRRVVSTAGEPRSPSSGQASQRGGDR